MEGGVRKVLSSSHTLQDVEVHGLNKGSSHLLQYLGWSAVGSRADHNAQMLNVPLVFSMIAVPFILETESALDIL